jgi:hypothetical protein
VAGDEDVDALFDLGVDEFVAARDRLAAELRRAGDRPAAEAVRKLRRPTVVAWVLNQLARRHRDDVADLLEVGRQAAAAQHQALAGDAAGLRDVDRRRRAAIAGLIDAAGDLVGGGRAHLDEVEASLQAASLDPDGAGAGLRAGRLSAAIPAASGFDLALAGWSPSTGPEPAPPRPSRPGRSRARARTTPGHGEDGGTADDGDGADVVQGDEGEDTEAAERERRDQERRRARQEARHRADELARAAQEAEAELTELDRELVRLQARVDGARQQAQQARRQAREARRRADTIGEDRPG